MVDTPTSTTQVAGTILVVDDRKELLDGLERMLVQNGYRVYTARDGESGLAMALELSPDLVILDIGLPRRNGLAVARELRARNFTAPVLILTARDTVADKVKGLDAGADDYMAKPFDYDELAGRVRAMLRGAHDRARNKLVRVGSFTLDPLAREITQNDRRLSLTQREYALLEFFLRHPRAPLSREAISEEVWNHEFDPSTNIVDVYVKYLRKKLDDGPNLLRTVRGVGYILMA